MLHPTHNLERRAGSHFVECTVCGYPSVSNNMKDPCPGEMKQPGTIAKEFINRCDNHKEFNETCGRCEANATPEYLSFRKSHTGYEAPILRQPDCYIPVDRNIVAAVLTGDLIVDRDPRPIITGDEETKKHDGGKPQFHLIPCEPLAELGRVYVFGAKKYAPNNWRKGTAWSRFYDAMYRHMQAWWAGEKNDGETKCHHLASVAWCAFTLMWYEMFDRGTDDRYKGKREPVEPAPPFPLPPESRL